jgi:hypothetical protein
MKGAQLKVEGCPTRGSKLYLAATASRHPIFARDQPACPPTCQQQQLLGIRRQPQARRSHRRRLLLVGGRGGRLHCLHHAPLQLAMSQQRVACSIEGGRRVAWLF